MSWSDPVSDMLVRIRNAQSAGHETVEMPSSKVKAEIARILKREGYVKDYAVEGGTKRILRVFLKYAADRTPAIRGARRESRPGLRRYAGADELPRVLGGLGTAILSTPQGIMTSREAGRLRIGGEVVCSVW